MIRTLRTPISRRFWAALSFQGLLIAALTLPPLLTYWRGSPVVLQTIPVDPYDLLRGYSQTLRYDISDPATLRTLPGGHSLDPLPAPNTRVYVTLQPPDLRDEIPPKPWKAIAVSLDLPDSLAEGEVLLQGEIASNRQIHYGLERYYFPEDRQEDIARQIRAVGLRPGSANLLRVEVRVERRGRAIPAALWIGDRRYQF